MHLIPVLHTLNYVLIQVRQIYVTVVHWCTWVKCSFDALSSGQNVVRCPLSVPSVDKMCVLSGALPTFCTPMPHRIEQVPFLLFSPVGLKHPQSTGDVVDNLIPLRMQVWMPIW